MVRGDDNRPHHSRLYLRNDYSLVAKLLAGRRLTKNYIFKRYP
jgi:hypothetical protein